MTGLGVLTGLASVSRGLLAAGELPAQGRPRDRAGGTTPAQAAIVPSAATLMRLTT